MPFARDVARVKVFASLCDSSMFFPYYGMFYLGGKPFAALALIPLSTLGFTGPCFYNHHVRIEGDRTNHHGHFAIICPCLGYLSSFSRKSRGHTGRISVQVRSLRFRLDVLSMVPMVKLQNGRINSFRCPAW